MTRFSISNSLEVLPNYGHHRYSKARPSGGKELTTRVEDMMHSMTKGGARKQRYMKAATMTRKAKNDEERKAQRVEKKKEEVLQRRAPRERARNPSRLPLKQRGRRPGKIRWLGPGI